MNLDTVGDDSIEAIREKERMYEAAIRSGDYLDGRFWADTWCAAFVWKKTREFSYPITEEVFRRIERNPHACEPWMRRRSSACRESTASSIGTWRSRTSFTAARREAPNERAGWNGGFDVVLGNPPGRGSTSRERVVCHQVRGGNERTKRGCSQEGDLEDQDGRSCPLH